MMSNVHRFQSTFLSRAMNPDSGAGACRTVRLLMVVCAAAILVSAGCGYVNYRNIINPGKWKGLETTDPDEHYYLLKDSSLSSGSPGTTSEMFEHTMNPTIFLFFKPRNEKNYYVAESKWYDPLGVEYRNIRSTHDIQQEGKKDVSPRNPKDGTQRVHTIATRELYNHKPGMWKVELFLDGELARRFEFSVR